MFVGELPEGFVGRNRENSFPKYDELLALSFQQKFQLHLSPLNWGNLLLKTHPHISFVSGCVW